VFHFTRRKRRFAACSLACLLAAIGVFAGGAIRRGGIIPMLPHPVLAWLLERATPIPATRAGADVPTAILPNGTTAFFRDTDSPWKRLSWNQQYVHAIRAWGDLVASDDPKVFADTARVHAAAAGMNTWRQYHNSTAFIDSWIVMDEINRQSARIERKSALTVPLAAGATVPLNRAELFMMAFLPPRNECEGVGLRGAPYTPAPQLYLAAMATSPNSDLQVYAMQRLGPEPAGAVDIDALLVRLETGGADQKARETAATIRAWRVGYMEWLANKR
jgi:hypothetical protein